MVIIYGLVGGFKHVLFSIWYIWDNPSQPDGDFAKIVSGDGDPLFSWAAPGDGVMDRAQAGHEQMEPVLDREDTYAFRMHFANWP
jgi:hypothetical protein